MKTTTQNNKLIAEFMGYQIYPDDTCDTKPTNLTIENSVRELRFMFQNWDELMPVAQRIENIEDENLSDEVIGVHPYAVEIKQNICKIHGTDIEVSISDKLTNTYQAIVEFIERYTK